MKRKTKVKVKYCKKHKQVELLDGTFYRNVCRICDADMFDRCLTCGARRLDCCC